MPSRGQLPLYSPLSSHEDQAQLEWLSQLEKELQEAHKSSKTEAEWPQQFEATLKLVEDMLYSETARRENILVELDKKTAKVQCLSAN